MVRILSNLDFEAWRMLSGAKVVEGSERRIEAQFVRVHVAGGAANDANKRIEVVSIIR